MSNINPNNIDQDYPIAGQDNDSQGFRDNFTNIRTNFDYTKEELEDLAGKVILKSALQGTTLDNDMAGGEIKSASMLDMRGVVPNATPGTGIINIDVTEGSYFKTTSTGNIELNFINFPATGAHSTVRVEIDIADIAHTVTLPSTVEVSATGNLIGFTPPDTITYTETGKYIYEFSTTDNGSTFQVRELTRNHVSKYRTIAASIGTAGDTQGMTAFNDGFAYFCTADYDGATSIWARVAIATW